MTDNDIQRSLTLNHIIDEMITIEGGFKIDEMCVFRVPSGNGKSVVAIEGDPSSGIIWSATQKERSNERL